MSIDTSIAAGGGVGRAVAQRPYTFFFTMAIVFVVIAFGGFARTYLIPVATGQFRGPGLMHLHGLLFFAWTVLWAVQIRLAGNGRFDLHRALGLATISLATAMVITAVALLVRGLNASLAAADVAGARLAGLMPLTQISMFAGFFAAAIANARKPEVHRRLMLLATVSLLNAPLARILLAFLAPGITSLTDPALGTGPRLAAALGGALVVDLLVVVAMVHDWRTRGRAHRTYMVGIAVILLVQVLRIPFARTPLWTWIRDGLIGLAG